MVIRVIAKPCGVRTQAAPRGGEPLTFGVPLSRGAVRDVSDWSLTGPDGHSHPVQARVLDRWPDGSIRWALVDAQADVDGATDTHLTLTAGAGTALPSSRIAILDRDGATEVDTGPACFRFGAGSGLPFLSVTASDGRPLAGGCGLTLTEPAGAAHVAEISTVQIESAGPLRTVVRLEGRIEAGRGRRLAVTVRVHLFAGLTTGRVMVTLTNTDRATHKGGFWDLGDPGSVLIKDLALKVGLPAGEGSLQVRAAAEAGAPMVPAEMPLEVYQDSSGGEYWQSTIHLNRERRVPNSFRGYRFTAGTASQQGRRATPIVACDRGRQRIACAVPYFWQNFPMAIACDAEGITLRLWPSQYADLHELQGGEQKTYETWWGFGDDARSLDVLTWATARTVVCVDPAWTIESGAVPFLGTLEHGQAALAQAAVEGPTRFQVKRETIDEFGWRHFGEIYGDHEAIRQKSPPLVSHYNNQYDPIAGFALQFLRTAEPSWWTMAAELAAHVVDIDVYHTTKDKSAYNRGLFWHTYHYGDADIATHRTYPANAKGRTHGGGPSADHNYTSGLMLVYFLTGDEWARQTVVDLAQFVVDLDDGRLTELRYLDRGSTGRATLSAGYYGPGRGPANSLNALLDGYRLSARAGFRAKAEEVLRRVVHPDEDVTRHQLDDPERRWFYTMFLQSLGKYLHDKVERHELDAAYAYGRASLLRYSRWMADHEHPILDKPEKVEFPTETWAAQDIRKSDVFSYAALHAQGEERARFLERAQYFHRYSISTLEKAPTRALARPVIILLTSGALEAWVRAHPMAVEPEPTHRPAAFPPQPRFEPQRVRAIRRLLWVSAAGVVLAVAAAVALLTMR